MQIYQSYLSLVLDLFSDSVSYIQYSHPLLLMLRVDVRLSCISLPVLSFVVLFFFISLSFKIKPQSPLLNGKPNSINIHLL